LLAGRLTRVLTGQSRSVSSAAGCSSDVTSPSVSPSHSGQSGGSTITGMRQVIRTKASHATMAGPPSAEAAMSVPAKGFAVREDRAGSPSHEVTGTAGSVEPAVHAFLLDLFVADCSPATVKSYAFALCSWLNFLAANATAWQNARPEHLRDYVLHLRTADNPHRARHRKDGPAPGSANTRTGKPYLAAGYQPATINHRLSVIQGFYAFQQHATGCAAFERLFVVGHRRAHHSPLDPWPLRRRTGYRQRQPKRIPRALTDDLWKDVFASLAFDRDRAILCLLVSSGSRAQELLDMRAADVDWGGQRVCLTCKGTRDRTWVAASPEFFRWLAAYLTQRSHAPPEAPLWVTLRRPVRPLRYPALRAVFTRVNARLGTNIMAHDLRHTCALRLAADPAVPLVHVQAHMRHRHIATTEHYLIARPDDVVAQLRAHLSRKPSAGGSAAAGADAWNYEPSDLAVLLGGNGSRR
jgi:integrase